MSSSPKKPNEVGKFPGSIDFYVKRSILRTVVPRFVPLCLVAIGEKLVPLAGNEDEHK